MGMVLNKFASTHSRLYHSTKNFLAALKPKGHVLLNTLFEDVEMGLVDITSEMDVKS